ncbi:MAG TPA: winged helix-turn-helix domain-containing protein [Blastocatellia bacterium]|nr:winged helix-turn-helix domain-containing protein [Blastocatellia bacterium]
MQTTSYSFDNFFLDVVNRQLLREGRPLGLTSRYFDVLLLLVSNSGQLVEKQRIFDEVWNGVFVTDAALTQCIKDIRRQLGDDASRPRYIKTVPKHGYVFIGQVVESPEARRIAPPDATAAKPAQRPFKFLDYFTEQDAALFFGREEEAEKICSQILAHRSFILHGRSGVGKSSILRAGLMPRLKAMGHSVFVIRSFTDPLHQMASALAESQGAGSLESLVERAAKDAPDRCIVFFLDQFEEFFLLLAEETRQAFINAIGRLASDERLPVRLVFALREDMLAEMSRLKPAVPEIFHHEYRLKRLTREQAKRAITGPAERMGCRFEDALVERILDDLSDREGIDPPQMQIVCDSLYDFREGDSALTVAAYERLGTASQILAGYLERVLRRFNASDLSLVRRILTALITAEGGRAVLRSSELAARAGTGPDDRETVSRLLEDLVTARVVRFRSQEGEAWIELAHDFLTAEVSRWMTAGDVALKRARGVLDRAMENHRAHNLLIDADALDLLLPFGEQLTLSGEEADLLAASLLNRARSVPEWLAKRAPSISGLIEAIIDHPDRELRLRAVEACRFVRSDRIRDLLKKSALWDEDLMVRKSASITLATWLGTEAEKLLSEETTQPRAGIIRRAISLAMIRDYDKRLMRFSHLSVVVGLLVFFGLIWVRIRRGAGDILRQGTGGTLGGAASGFAGGLMLGISLAIRRHAPALDSFSLVLTLVSLGTFVGALGGLGVSFGIVSASFIAYRHSRWWSVVGGAAGGAAIGGMTKLLGLDILKALFGQSLIGLAGALEGAVIGAAVSLGAVVVLQLNGRATPLQRVAGASLGAMCAGVLLTVIGGNLFSGSLEIVARSFADSQVRMEPLAPLFGEVHFGRTTQIVLGAIEGLLFGAGMTGGIEIAARRKSETASSLPLLS